MNLSSDSLPAILGGPRACSEDCCWPLADPEVETALQSVWQSGDWGRYHGTRCPELAERLNQLHGTSHCLLTCSGTAAVELALRGCRVEAGSEVVMAAYDFKANFTNITMLGARPVLVDINPLSGQFDVEHVSSALTDHTRAILASHLHGGSVDMQRLMAIAAEANVPVIEDACQATLGAVQARTAGTWGDVAVISFGGSKLLTAGRGGAVLSSNAEIMQRIRVFNQRGNEAYPLSELQAAVLLPQLLYLPERRGRRQRSVNAILDRLGENSGLLPLAMPANAAALDFYKLGFWYDPTAFDGLDRERFCAAMRAEGIPLDPGFRALHKIHARRRYRTSGLLRNAERADDSLIVLHHPFLLRESAVEEFAFALDRLRKHARMIPRDPQNNSAESGDSL